MLTYLLAIVCVIGIAIGQILFKLASMSLQRSGSWFDTRTISVLLIAFLLYGFTTILWVYVLQKLELGRAYPLMAFAFAVVPVGSYFVFGEKFQIQYFIGVAMIVSGIIISIRS